MIVYKHRLISKVFTSMSVNQVNWKHLRQTRFAHAMLVHAMSCDVGIDDLMRKLRFDGRQAE